MDLGQDASGNRLISASEEGISIASGGTAPAPLLLKPKYVSGTYTFFVTANDASFLANDGTLYPVVRLWSKGTLIGTYKLEASVSGCDGSAAWWKVFTLNNTNPPAGVNTCGSAGLPYFPYSP